MQNREQLLALKRDRIIVKAGDDVAIAITDLQPAGKKRMPADVFIRGTGSKWSEGDQFE